MSEKPILFGAEMVRAILDGRKTQTRRPIVLPPAIRRRVHPPGHWMPRCLRDRDQDKWAVLCWPADESETFPLRSLYAVGDTLWVRETHGYVWPMGCEDGMVYGDGLPVDGRPITPQECIVEYRADLPPGCTDAPGGWPTDDPNEPSPIHWRPSIHMERWAARIMLEVTAVRAERVREISEGDAWAEGFSDPKGANRGYPDRARYWFRLLWDSIYGKGGGWEANPWVWVYTFLVVEE